MYILGQRNREIAYTPKGAAMTLSFQRPPSRRDRLSDSIHDPAGKTLALDREIKQSTRVELSEWIVELSLEVLRLKQEVNVLYLECQER